MGVRAWLIRIVTFLGGLYFFLKFVLPERTGFSNYHEQISDGFVLVGAMALALGLINLLMVHGSKVLYRRRGWSSSIALLAGLFAMLSVTVLDWQATSGVYRNTEEVMRMKLFAERIVSDQAKGEVPTHSVEQSLSASSILPADLVGAPRTPEVRVRFLHAALLEVLPRVTQGVKEAQWTVELKGGSDERALFKRAWGDFKEAEVAVRSGLVNLEDVSSGDVPSVEVRTAALQALAQGLGRMASAYQGIQEAAYRTSLLRRIYGLLFDGFFISLGAAMFSLLGFYICAAAYRAFRIRSMESALMMTAALLVMLGQIPFGLWLSEALPGIRLWLLQVPSTGAARAIEIGASVAGLVMAFRMWLSIESESFR